MRPTLKRLPTIGILAPVILLLGLASPAAGAPLMQGVMIHPDSAAPDSTSTDGFCSLREAIIAANKDSSSPDCPAGNGHDTIVLEPGATYTLSKSDNGKEDSGSSGDLDIAGLNAREGHAEGALRLVGAAGALRQSIGAPLPPLEQENLDRLLGPALQALSSEAQAAFRQAGQGMTLDQALDFAMAESGTGAPQSKS